MFHLAIATPEKVVYDDEIESVSIPGTLGYMQVLTHHAPLITSLRQGNVTLITKSSEKITYSISGGIFEVEHNQALLLADFITPSCVN